MFASSKKSLIQKKNSVLCEQLDSIFVDIFKKSNRFYMSTPLHSKFTALEHPAEGQMLCGTENVVESLTSRTGTRSSVLSKRGA